MNRRNFFIITVISAISLTAYGFISYQKSPSCNLDIGSADVSLDFEFVYLIQPRFNKTVQKTVTDKALSVIDIIPAEDSEAITSFHNIHLTRFAEGRENWITIISEDETFNPEQIKMLRSLGHGESFSITGNIRKKDNASCGSKLDTLIYYMTTMPTQPAEYKDGMEALISYLKIYSLEHIALANEDQLKPGKIYFTITKDGTIDHVKLTNTSGYPSIDERMLLLIRDIPGKWKAATNADGENVDHVLTFFFGMIGC